MRKTITAMMAAVLMNTAAWGQQAPPQKGQQAPPSAPERPFPYPAVPDTVREAQQRVAYVLEHYWSQHEFDDTTAVNRTCEEQGFVDFIFLLQYADSALAARSAQAWADSIGRTAERQQRFDALTDHYLGNPDSPLRNDATYVQLLRVLPATAQRQFLLRQLMMNQRGTKAADITFRPDNGRDTTLLAEQRLYEVESPMVLLVFHDPDCEHCHELMPFIRSSHVLRANSERVRVFYINIEAKENAHIRKDYYLPALPALYLLDAEKRVLVKDGTLKQVEEMVSGER